MNEAKRNECMLDPLVVRHSDSVTIIHGDCRDVLPVGCDAIVTDPPYGIGFGRKHTKWSTNRGTLLGAWDTEPTDMKWLVDEHNGQTDAATLIVWGGERFGLPIQRGWLAWIKPDAAPTFSSMELAWTNRDKPARHIIHSIGATNAERGGHPTQKPVRVMVWCMAQCNIPDGATVLDPYMGSGTTGIACIRTGRKFIGIEKDARYFEIARARLENELRQGLLPLTYNAEHHARPERT